MKLLLIMLLIKVELPNADATLIGMSFDEMQKLRRAIDNERLNENKSEQWCPEKHNYIISAKICNEAYSRLKTAGAIDDEDVSNMTEAGLMPDVVHIHGTAFFGGFKRVICR